MTDFLIALFEALGKIVHPIQKLLWVVVGACLLVPIGLLATADGPLIELKTSVSVLFGLALLGWALSLCAGWYHPNAGAMKLPPDGEGSAVRHIFRGLSSVLLLVYFLAGIAITSLPLWS